MAEEILETKVEKEKKEIKEIKETPKIERNLYIFDLDGTLCDITHRIHYIRNCNGTKLKHPDWKTFFKECINDKPIPETMEIFHTLKDTGKCVCIISGRSDEVMEETAEWLKKQGVNLESGALGGLILSMRQAGDHRPDVEVKPGLLAEVLGLLHRDFPNTKWNPVIFEDRKSVVDMWRKLGFQVYQVAPGEF